MKKKMKVVLVAVLKDVSVQVEKFCGKETVLMNQNVQVKMKFVIIYSFGV